MVVNKTDIAIIGGGIQGLFLAYYAKKRCPSRKIVLFEAKIIGSGITAYSGHLHMPYGSGEKKELTKLSLSLYADLCSEYSDFPLETRKFIGICKKENLDSIISDITEENLLMNSVNYSFKELSENYVTISGMNGHVSKRSISNYLMELITKLDVIVYEGTEIVTTKKDNDGFELLTQTGQKFKSSILLNSSGSSIYSLVKLKNSTLRTKKVVAFHLNHPPLNDDPIVYFFDDDAFLLPQPYYNRYLFSYKCEEWDVNSDSNSFKINPIDIEEAQKVLKKFTHDLYTKILGGQVHIDIYNSPASSPLIIEMEKDYYAIGATGGSGVRLAPALAIKTLNKINL